VPSVTRAWKRFVAVGLNRHATFSPKEAIDILLAVDEVAPRKGSNIPNYQHKVVSKLRG
jgi:hypothetical protein